MENKTLEELKKANDKIERNFNQINIENKGDVSQDILPSLRSLLDAINVFIYGKDNKKQINSIGYKEIKDAKLYINSNNKYSDIKKFYDNFKLLHLITFQILNIQSD